MNEPKDDECHLHRGRSSRDADPFYEVTPGAQLTGVLATARCDVVADDDRSRSVEGHPRADKRDKDGNDPPHGISLFHRPLGDSCIGRSRQPILDVPIARTSRNARYAPRIVDLRCKRGLDLVDPVFVAEG